MTPSDSEGQSQLTSPPWRTETRIVTAILLILLVVVVLYGLRQLLGPLVLALILAYLLHPLVNRLTRWGVPRWGAVLIVYFVLIVLIIAVTTGAGFAISQQVVGVVRDIGELSVELPGQLNRLAQSTVTLGPWEIDLSQTNLTPVIEAILSGIQPVLSQTGVLLASVLSATASTVGLSLLILVMGYYLLKDFETLDDAFIGLVPPDYQADFRRLLAESARVWQSFLRGQLILGLIIGAVTGAVYLTIGLRFALGLGLIAGLLEFVPIFGPIIAGTFAVLVALLQGTNFWGLSPAAFALMVLIIAVLIQQIENNILVPRIIGMSLQLHPLVVLVAALAGGILAGVLGVLLAAPVVATARICLGYVYGKTVGLDSWPGVLQVAPAVKPGPSLRERLARILKRLRRREPAGKVSSEPSPGADEGSH